MTKYTITDIDKGLFSGAIEIEANSPREALTLAGYENAKRDYQRYGSIIVGRRIKTYYGSKYVTFVYQNLEDDKNEILQNEEAMVF